MRGWDKAARPGVIRGGGRARGRVVSQEVLALDCLAVLEHRRGMKMSQ